VRRKWKAFDWEDLSDDELLQIRIRDLKVHISGSSLQRLVDDLYEELDAKGISFHPDCYLADEWLTPEKIPIIGIPFYLAHPRLRQLEKKLMYDVEGGTERSCMSQHLIEAYPRIRLKLASPVQPFEQDTSRQMHIQITMTRIVCHRIIIQVTDNPCFGSAYQYPGWQQISIPL